MIDGVENCRFKVAGLLLFLVVNGSPSNLGGSHVREHAVSKLRSELKIDFIIGSAAGNSSGWGRVIAVDIYIHVYIVI